MQILNILGKGTAFLSKVNRIILGVLLSIMTISVFAQVVCRYIFLFGLSWSEELARLCLIYVALLGASIIIGEDEHIKIELFDRPSFPPRIFRVLKILRLVFSLAFLGIAFYSSLKGMRVGMSSIMLGLGISTGWVYGVFVVGFALALIYAIEALIKSIVTKPGGTGEGGK